MENVSIEDVMQMDAAKIFKFAGEYGVSLAGCKNLDQFRERLVLHLQVLRRQYFDIQREFGVRRSDSLGTTNQTLDKLLTSVQAAMSGLDPALEHVLVDPSGSDDKASLIQQIEARRSSLRAAECSIVVAGETNSGKSTVLNLLLGMDVLPTFILSCTAAVCVLRYAENFSAEIVYQDSRRKQASFGGVEETHEWLEENVAEKDLEKREKGLGIDVINVHLPAVILQSGVTLVDTPGIGENEAMYNCAMNFVKRNSAAAYIYVIKTDNAGGVHDDRLLDFLRAILVHNKRDEDSEAFDPSSAMFVCNRWDQVPEEQREGVKENALNKLKDVWPKFDPRQAFFLSATNAQMHYDANPRYVTEDFEEMLNGVKDMFNKARHNAINQHYRWLKHLLQQSTSTLQTTILHCSQSDEELISRCRATKNKLDALQQRTITTTLQLRSQVRHEMKNLCREIAKILQKEDVKRELLDWSSAPYPSAPALGSGEAQRWQEEMDMAIMKRIMEKVDTELKNRGLDQRLQDTLKEMVQKELRLVDEEINSILVDMADRTSISSSMSSNSSFLSKEWDDEPAQEMLRIYNERGGLRLNNLRHLAQHNNFKAGSAASSEATLASVPKVMLRALLNPLAKVMAAVARRRRQSQFSMNPMLYMTERTQKILDVVSEKSEFLLHMTAKYHEKLDAFIADVDNSIPRFIASNKQLMEEIRNNRKTYLTHRNELIRIMENLEPIRELLRGFGCLYIKDVTADNINLTLDAEQRRQSVAVSVQKSASVPKDSGLGESADNGMAGGSSKQIVPICRTSQGLWSTYRWGHVAIGEDKEHVIGRSYIQAFDENSLIKEIARLRCLRSTHLAPFLGMSRMEESAVFLFVGDLMSVHRYLSRGFHEPRDSVPHVLNGVLNGLMYLNHEGLVHMELSLDTIMVNREGEPKLCGACLPRKARFPPDANKVNAEPFVCLSPEVLRGELYTADDDVYSFGLVVWETCLRSKPYSEQRHLSLQEFRSKVHPSSMLGIDSIDDLSENLSAILRGCLLPARGLRIRTDDLREKVAALRSDPVVQSLPSIARRNCFRPVRRTAVDDTKLKQTF